MPRPTACALLGSVRQLYDSAGQIVANRRYEPFGSLLSASGTDLTVYGFAGEPLDASTGLVYLRARYLDTDLGRFTQVDPSGWEANPYLYAGVNPANYVDPSGLWPGVPPSPSDREAWDTWMRNVGLPWLYKVYIQHNWEYHLGADFPTVARAYEAGEAAARENPIDRPNIVSWAIADAIPFRGSNAFTAEQQRGLALRGLAHIAIRDHLMERPFMAEAIAYEDSLKLEQWIGAFTWAGVLRFMPICGACESREEQLEPLRLGPRRGGNTRWTANGNRAHYVDLPPQVRQRYPDTEFHIAGPFERGPDVTYLRGTHPSQYPGSTWPEGFDYADFKPLSPSGVRQFYTDLNTGKPVPDTVPLFYDRDTNTLLPDVP